MSPLGMLNQQMGFQDRRSGEGSGGKERTELGPVRFSRVGFCLFKSQVLPFMIIVTVNMGVQAEYSPITVGISFLESHSAAQMKTCVSRFPTYQMCFHSKHSSNHKNNNHKESSYLGGELESSQTSAINVGPFLIPYKHKNWNGSLQG